MHLSTLLSSWYNSLRKSFSASSASAKVVSLVLALFSCRYFRYILRRLYAIKSPANPAGAEPSSSSSCRPNCNSGYPSSSSSPRRSESASVEEEVAHLHSIYPVTCCPKSYQPVIRCSTSSQRVNYLPDFLLATLVQGFQFLPFASYAVPSRSAIPKVLSFLSGPSSQGPPSRLKLFFSRQSTCGRAEEQA